MEPRERREMNPLPDMAARLSCTQIDACSSPKGDLVFPPEHELSLLWSICSRERREEDMRLTLCPEEEQQLPLDEERLAQESMRAHVFLTQVARVRLRQMADGVSADEAAVVFLSSDSMVAWMFFLPPVGEGKQLRASQIHQVLSQRGVVYGIRWNTICEMCECSNRYFHMFVLACGKAPVPGENGTVEDRYLRVLRANIQVDELGEADYEALNLVQDIKKDDIICQIIPPVKGRDGRTVTGKIVPAMKGEPAEVPQGRNTYLSEDGSYLRAAIDGHLYFSGRSFQVKPVLHLNEDSLPLEENIKFLGDIHVHGDLCGEISICAIGNIQIDGVMEAGTVIAGENIIVSSGVQGQKRAVLHAQQGVYAKYLEHCSVYAQESVQADCIIGCDIYSNGDVRVRTGRGAVVGGTIRAAREVSATTVGSKAERETLIVLGGKPCEEAERKQIEEQIQQIDQQLAQVLKEGKPNQVQICAKMRLNQCVARMKLEKIEKDLRAYEVAGLKPDPRRLVCDTAYPATHVIIGHVSYEMTQEYHDCALGLVDGKIRRITMP